MLGAEADQRRCKGCFRWLRTAFLRGSVTVRQGGREKSCENVLFCALVLWWGLCGYSRLPSLSLLRILGLGFKDIWHLSQENPEFENEIEIITVIIIIIIITTITTQDRQHIAPITMPWCYQQSSGVSVLSFCMYNGFLNSTSLFEFVAESMLRPTSEFGVEGSNKVFSSVYRVSVPIY